MDSAAQTGDLRAGFSCHACSLGKVYSISFPKDLWSGCRSSHSQGHLIVLHHDLSTP